MRRTTKGCGGYRGRVTVTDVLKVIAIVLAVLVVLALGGLFFGQDYIVFTDNGLKLELPFQIGKGDKDDVGDVSVDIQDGSDQSQQEPEQPPVDNPTDNPTDTPTDNPTDNPVQQPPAAKPKIMTAIEVPAANLVDGSASQKMLAVGVNSVVVTMKGTDGMLGFQSAQSVANGSKVNANTAGINEALKAWNAGDVYTVARVCCFRDNTVPYHNNSMALRASYGNWRDELNLRWLNPDNSQAQAYVVELCRELAELGFDEILLECCSFPTQGNLGAISKKGAFASGEYSAAVESLLTQVRTAVSPMGTKIGVRVDRAGLADANGLGGLSASVLERLTDRIWATEDGGTPTLAEAAAAVGISDAKNRVVCVAKDFATSPYGNVAVLN